MDLNLQVITIGIKKMSMLKDMGFKLQIQMILIKEVLLINTEDKKNLLVKVMFLVKNKNLQFSNSNNLD